VLCEIACIGLCEVERLNRDTPVYQGVKKMVDHGLRAPVHGDVGENHHVLHGIARPVPVSIDYERRSSVNGAVARCNDLYLARREFLKVPLMLARNGIMISA